MPLIVISGLPCSGKTTIAKKLKNYFETMKGIKTIIISEESFYNDGEDRNTIYSDSNKEKKLRASMKSGVERDLCKESILIFDSLNYVKGSRYEFYCISKCNSTTQCTVHCSISLEDAKVLNAKRSGADKYDDSVLEGLFMRYEVPDGKNRWDSPLFNVPLIIKHESDEGNGDGEEGNNNNNNNRKVFVNSNKNIVENRNDTNDYNDDDDEDNENDDNKSKGGDRNTCVLDEETMLQEMYDCLMLKKCPKPHLSTITAPVLPANFLHEVDNITKTVVQEIMGKQQNCVPGDKIIINAPNNYVEFTKPFSMAELQRIRRQYVAYSRTHPISNPSLISASFVQYVNSRSEL